MLATQRCVLSGVLAFAIALPWGCRGDQPAEQPAKELASPPPAAAPATATDEALAAKIRGLLKPWHVVKPEWQSEATVIVVGRGGRMRGPCVFRGSMSFMPLLETFNDLRVLKGDVKSAQIVFRFGTSTNLSNFTEGRKYLLFLKPGEEDLKDLGKTEDYNFGCIGSGQSGEVVGAVDLGQTEDEARLPTIKASRSGAWNGFEFTPAVWQRMREAATVDFKEQQRLIDFLENVVLLRGRRLVDIAEWLGQPDSVSGTLKATYHLNLAASDNSEEGQVIVNLDLEFRESGTLFRCKMVPVICHVERHEDYTTHSTTNVPEADLAKLGLRCVEKEFPPPADQPK